MVVRYIYQRTHRGHHQSTFFSPVIHNVALRLCLFALGLHLAYARPSTHQIDLWTTENGLPQNSIIDVCQTPDGYLWLATLDGLARFDGVRFVVFNHTNNSGILGNRLTSLYCAYDGEIWAGTLTGIVRYRRGEFTTYTVRQGLPSNLVMSVTGDGTGNIWALSQDIIVQWNQESNTFSELNDSNALHAYTLLRGSDFWAIDKDNLIVFNQGRFLYYAMPKGWSRQTLRIIDEDFNGTIWMADQKGRFARLRQGKWEMISPKHNGSAAASHDLTYTYLDSQGNAWKIVTGFAPDGYLQQALLLSSRDRPQRLHFKSLLQDREGNLWLSTSGQGLYRIRKQTVHTLSKADGLPDKNVYPIYQDKTGVIWAGTWSGGLSRYKNGKFSTFPTVNGLNSKRITAIGEDNDGRLWVGTYGGLYEMLGGRFVAVRNEALSGKVVAAIHRDKENTLWLGTDRGLVRYRDRQWSVITKKDGLAGDDIRIIIDGQAGELWMGGYEGLTSLYRGRFTRWIEPDDLPSSNIRSLYEDADGVLWIGTYDRGLERLQDGRFTRVSTREGLFDNGVFQILEDTEGYLWMSCNRGIYRVLKKEMTEYAQGKRSVISSIAYGKSDGMLNTECNGGLSPAGILTRDGELWFPTQDGIAVIDPERVETNLRQPPVAIESVFVDQQTRAPDRTIVIQPAQDNIEIEYSAPSLINSERIRFRYKLIGQDRDWVNVYNRRTAYYSHLQPGEYEFRVIAANADGIWNMAGAQIHISVLPHFYQTWWFASIILLASGGALAFAWRSRVLRLEAARTAQQSFSRQLIASHESERKHIAAELHDSLGQQLVVIRNWASLALRGMDEPHPLRRPLDEISEMASRVIDEVREIAYNLRPFQLEKFGLTAAIEDLVDQVAASSAIRLEAEIDPINEAFSKDEAIHVYRIIQEGLSNIVRHSMATEARILIKEDEGQLFVTISDNGRGFLLSGHQTESGHSGFGLMGVAERVRILGGKWQVESSPGSGTIIKVFIDLRKNQG